MKIIINFAIIIVLSAMLFSCSKNETQELTGENETENSGRLLKTVIKTKPEVNTYYIDNEEVTESIFIQTEALQENFNVFADCQSNITNDTLFITFFGFSTEELYIQFGEQNNIKIEEQLKFEHKMVEYAGIHKIDSIYEATGEVPQSYFDFANNCYLQNFGETPNLEAWAAAFYKELNKQGDCAIHHGLTPFLNPGWKNTISSFQFIGIYGITRLYKKPFFIKGMVTYNDWAYNTINLPSRYNNKTQSLIVW